MRHIRRHERERAGAPEDPETSRCNHVWRDRAISYAMPGPYVTEVCERCGALHIAGPDELTGQAVASWNRDRSWRNDDVHLEDLARLWSPPDEWTPSTAE
jgi:hypothetical protein